jgi:hypothetical protein
LPEQFSGSSTLEFQDENTAGTAMSDPSLSVQRFASEIVQEVMMLVIMRESPTAITDVVAAKIQVMLETISADS